MTTEIATTTRAQDSARIALGALLAFAGTSHLTFARKEFRAQVPPWVPMDTDDVVLLSGAAEIALGAGLMVLPKEKRRVGGIVATFFTAIFPGNISQYRNRIEGFGLDTDAKRAARLAGQPLLVAWALWSSGLLNRR